MIYILNVQTLHACMKYFHLTAAFLTGCIVMTGLNARSYDSVFRSGLRMIQDKHVRGLRNPDEHLEKAAKNTIFELDPFGVLFFERDVESLLSSAQSMRSFQTDQWIDRVNRVYKERIDERIDALQQLNSQSIEADDEYEMPFFFEDADYRDEPAGIQQTWINLIQYDALNRAYSSSSFQSRKEFTQHWDRNKSRLLQESAKNEIRKLKEMRDPQEGLSRSVFIIFMNSFFQSLDPHTNYLSRQMMERFTAPLSKKSDSFGIIVEKNPFSAVRVLRLVPGGPAWSSGQIHTGDIIIEVKFPGRKYMAADKSLYSIHEDLTSGSEKYVILTIRKPDGEIRSVKLFRETLDVDQNIISGFVLESDNFRAGYISLPGFYHQWDDPSRPGATNDIAREIIQLKRERIQGLILDLRNNGGGSLGEALDLAGLFIDEGPLVIARNKSGREVVLSDRNRGAIYRDPVVILINDRSASASEFLAAILQDYNRAVVVGSTSMGKATSQEVLPLSDGFVKITTWTYYNLHGGTHQGVGVRPDIELMEVPFALKEEDLPGTLEPGKADKKPAIDKLTAVDTDQLVALSENRTGENDLFEKREELLESFEDYLEERNILLLNPADFFEQRTGLMNLYQSGLKLQKNQSGVRVRDHRANRDLTGIDRYRRELFEERKLDIQKNIYITESFYILKDYSELLGKKEKE